MGDQDASVRAASALAATQRMSLKSGGHGDPRAMRKAAEEFEGQFLARMLEPMFDGIETDGPGGGGFAEEMWRSLLVDEYGKALAAKGGVGLADNVMGELLRLQEKAGENAK